MSSHSVDDCIENSKSDFEKYVWPQISSNFISGELVAVEDSNEDFAELLDGVSGVDYWVIEEQGRGILSLASRVQPNYDKTTHTIRYERESGEPTEYQKRVYQVENELDYPKYTIQAYVDRTLGVLQNAAWVETKEFYHYLSKQHPPTEYGISPKVRTVPGERWAKFFSVDWTEMWGSLDSFDCQDPHRAGLFDKNTTLDHFREVTAADGGRVCSQCGHTIEAHERFCTHCGSDEWGGPDE